MSDRCLFAAARTPVGPQRRGVAADRIGVDRTLAVVLENGSDEVSRG